MPLRMLRCYAASQGLDFADLYLRVVLSSLIRHVEGTAAATSAKEPGAAVLSQLLTDCRGSGWAAECGPCQMVHNERAASSICAHYVYCSQCVAAGQFGLLAVMVHAAMLLVDSAAQPSAIMMTQRMRAYAAALPIMRATKRRALNGGAHQMRAAPATAS